MTKEEAINTLILALYRGEAIPAEVMQEIQAGMNTEGTDALADLKAQVEALEQKVTELEEKVKTNHPDP